jgi:integrase
LAPQARHKVDTLMNTTTRQVAGHIASLEAYIASMDERISDRTKREYTSLMDAVAKKILGAANNTDESVTAHNVVTHLTQLATEKSVANSTFRLTKSAAMYWLACAAKTRLDAGADITEHRQAYEAMGRLRYVEATNERRTSSKKLKAFSQDARESLETAARTQGRRSPNIARAASFVRANLLVGLRPNEWFDASFASYLQREEDGSLARNPDGSLVSFTPMLVVENSKATQGRANGTERELLLHNVSADELKALMHWWHLAMQHRERHPTNTDNKKLTANLYKPLNAALKRALASNGTTPAIAPSTYSTRHQVIADWKKAGVPPRVIAAFFGHRSQHTQSDHYAKKKTGQGGAASTKFGPSPESLARVTTPGQGHRHGMEKLPEHLATQAENWAAEHARRTSGQ